MTVFSGVGVGRVVIFSPFSKNILPSNVSRLFVSKFPFMGFKMFGGTGESGLLVNILKTLKTIQVTMVIEVKTAVVTMLGNLFFFMVPKIRFLVLKIRNSAGNYKS